MPEITESFVNGEAPNASASANGRSLLMKNKLVALHQSADLSLIFGECRGSGKSNYHPSADFIDPAKPVYRCSCPSRQIPCKHVLALMFAHAGGKDFVVAEVPESITEKRDRALKRANKKAERVGSDQPRKVNVTALKKKLKAQLEGLDLLEQMTHDLLRNGLGNLNPKSARLIEERAKQLGDAFLPGAQSAMRSLILLFEHQGPARELAYTEAIDQLTRLHTLIKQGRKYLEVRRADPLTPPDATTDIAAWLGHAWQLQELRTAGLYETKAELAQLAFETYDDRARREHVDRGWWIHLGNGRIDCTLNYRPYRASQHIKEDDCHYEIAQIAELFQYPGEINRRIRWDGHQRRAATKQDWAKVCSFASPLADCIKQVKKVLKSPLGTRSPIMLSTFERIGTVDGELVLEDRDQERVILEDLSAFEAPPSCHLLDALRDEVLTNQTMLLRFGHDLNTHRLTAKPVSLVTAEELIRLEY